MAIFNGIPTIGGVNGGVPAIGASGFGEIQLTLEQLSAPIGNYFMFDESTDFDLDGGERIMPFGSAAEAVDSPITGMAPFFIENIRILDGANMVFQAPLTLNFIVYVGPGAFLRTNDGGILVHNNALIATPFGDLWDYKSVTIPGSIVFSENIGHAGLSPGYVKNFAQFQYKTFNNFDRVSGITIEDVIQIGITTYVQVLGPNPVGPGVNIVGDRTQRIFITDGVADGPPGSSYINISPSINDNAVIGVRNNIYGTAFGGDFFEPGVQGTIQSYSNNSSSGATDSYADNLAGGTTVFSTQTSPGNDRKVTLAATTNFDGTHKIFNDVPGVSFDIPVPFAVGGTVGTWTFNSVTVGSAGHTLVNGDAAQIYKSTNYNKGRIVFGVVPGVSFNIDDVPFNGDDAAGIFDTSIKQNDPRMTCVGNGDQPDTSTLINLGITVTETLTGTSTPQNIETWQVFRDDQFTLNPPGGTLGSWRYDARAKPLGTNIFARWIAVSGNPAADIEFLLKKSVAGGPFNQIGPDITGTLTNKSQTLSIFIEDDADFDDDYLLQFFDAANNSVNILNASISQYKIG